MDKDIALRILDELKEIKEKVTEIQIDSAVSKAAILTISDRVAVLEKKVAALEASKFKIALWTLMALVGGLIGIGIKKSIE